MRIKSDIPLQLILELRALSRETRKQIGRELLDTSTNESEGSWDSSSDSLDASDLPELLDVEGWVEALEETFEPIPGAPNAENDNLGDASQTDSLVDSVSQSICQSRVVELI
jgi:hypothetical protein